MKTKNKEQEEYNKERIIDINLILQYMETLDINKDYFTELGEGHLRGLASVKDEMKFVSQEMYDKLTIDYTHLLVKIEQLTKENSELKDKYNDLLRQNKKLKKKWF